MKYKHHKMIKKGKQQMKKCKYAIEFPGMGLHCMAYSYSKRPDNKWWAHFPECSKESCPLEHPKLLEGAVFDEEEFENRKENNK
jgi:hypothetical protein